MFKCMALLKKRADISREQFIDYYQTNHSVLIRKLHRKQKLTIILVEHDMRVIFNLADRITVLAEGEMLERGTPDEIANSEKVQVAYLGKKREGS